MKRASKNRIITTIILLALSQGAFSTDVAIRAAEIVGFGVFDATRTVARRGFSSRSMGKDDVSGIRFVEYTNKISAKRGLNFGFQYVINSTPKGKPIKVTSVIIFPEGGIPHPKGRVYTESRDAHEVIIGRKALHGYGFDEDWEMVPGTWIFELWHREARLIKKTFYVTVGDTEAKEDD